jgi:hypothetical protein
VSRKDENLDRQFDGRENLKMLYPTRVGGGGRRARPGEELALGASILFLISAFFAVVGGFQGAVAAFAAAMACVSLRMAGSSATEAT